MQEVSWYSLSWFSWDLITQEYSYERTYMLYVAILLPFILIVLGLYQIYKGANLKVDSEKKVTRSGLLLLAAIPWGCFLVSLALICFSLARPQKQKATSESYKNGIDIMLAIDISGSMIQGTDVKPNRLAKTKELAADFVSKRKNDNVGIVLFAGESFVKAPLTQDKPMLEQLIYEITPYEIQTQGTAIGSGCAMAISMLEKSKAASKVLILLSDGENTAGGISPLGAAALADAHNIKIYTIGVGVGNSGMGGVFNQFFAQEVDFTALKEMARITNGQFYHAVNEEVLETIFKEIDELETSKVEDHRFKFKSDYYHIYLSWGILFFMLFIALRSTFLVGMLRD